MLKELGDLMESSGMLGITPMGETGILSFCSGAGTIGAQCHAFDGAECDVYGPGQQCTSGAQGVVCDTAATAGAHCMNHALAVSCSPSNQAAFCYNVVGVIQC